MIIGGVKTATLKSSSDQKAIFQEDRGETGQGRLINGSHKVTLTRRTIRRTRQAAIDMHGTAA